VSHEIAAALGRLLHPIVEVDFAIPVRSCQILAKLNARTCSVSFASVSPRVSLLRCQSESRRRGDDDIVRRRKQSFRIMTGITRLMLTLSVHEQSNLLRKLDRLRKLPGYRAFG